MASTKAFKDPATGQNWTVRVVQKGDRYGLNNCLTSADADPLVEFYDLRHMHTEYGQFVSRYFLSTLLQHNRSYGLNLHGGVPTWSVSGECMGEVIEWLDAFVPDPATLSPKEQARYKVAP